MNIIAGTQTTPDICAVHGTVLVYTAGFHSVPAIFWRIGIWLGPTSAFITTGLLQPVFIKSNLFIFH